VPRFPLFHFEYTEVAELNPPIFGQGFDNRFEEFLDNTLNLLLGQAEQVGDRFDNFFFGHGAIGKRKLLQHPYGPVVSGLQVRRSTDRRDLLDGRQGVKTAGLTARKCKGRKY
jgi:hypothetical protein